MGEDYIPKEGSKKEKYEHVLEEMEFRLDASNHELSNLGNVVSMLREEFGWWWVGFYFVFQAKLVLGVFQGPPACTKIFKGSGVCGKCWELNKPIVVKNVNEFEGHIACSSKSVSEIVIPILESHSQTEKKFIGLLDVDSEKEAEFDEIDQEYLSKIIRQLEGMGQFRMWEGKQ